MQITFYILSIVSFAMQKLDVFCLLIFAFVVVLLPSHPKKSLPKINVREDFPMFSGWNFMVSSLMFKSLIHFKLIFCE